MKRTDLEALRRDAARYRLLRDVPVYDTGLAVADLPSERRDVKLLQGQPLDVAVDSAISARLK